jgi:hypothetical protein
VANEYKAPASRETGGFFMGEHDEAGIEFHGSSDQEQAAFHAV